MARNRVRILGELEAEIMEILWIAGRCSVREVLARIEKKRKIAYTTVMTVMTRLADKRILKRTMDTTGAFVYEPILDKKAFMINASQRLITDVLKTYGDVAIAQFIDVIEKLDPKRSGQWREKLRALIE